MKQCKTLTIKASITTKLHGAACSFKCRYLKTEDRNLRPHFKCVLFNRKVIRFSLPSPCTPNLSRLRICRLAFENYTNKVY